MSSFAPETALVATKAADEVPDLLTPPPNSDINFAEDEDALDWLNSNVTHLLDYVRGEYFAQHEQWAQIRRMASMERDENAAYDGRSTAYLPLYHRALETRVSHTSRGLFPSDTYIDTSSVIPNVLPIQTQTVKAWMMHQLERSMKLRSEIKPFLRNLYNYGISVAKVYWEKPPVAERKTRLTKLPGLDSVLFDFNKAQPWTYEGARFKARNVYAWYCWPASINSIDEASLIFEDIQVSKQYVEEMKRKGLWKNVEQALAGGQIPNTNVQAQAQLVETHRSPTTAVDYKGGDLADWRYLTEAWFRMPVPKELYRPGEEEGQSVPVRAIFVGTTCVEIRRNPFWHQKPPYLMKRLHENPDSLFTVGMGKAASSLQFLANDFINQTNDNGIYGLNPIVKINPNLIVGPIEPLEPGRMWHLTDPNGAVFDRPPIEQMQYGLMITNQLATYLNDLSGAPSSLQGTGSKGGAKTATGAQILQNNVKGDLQDIIEDIELQVLMPLMEMVHSLGQQYESAERYLIASGGEKMQFTREMLQGEYMWKWVASSQAVNQQMRAQSAMQFAQLLAGMAPLLAQQGQMPNLAPVLRKIYEDGLGLRNFDEVLQPAPPPMPGMGGPQGGPPGGPQGGPPPGQKPQQPRSAVEQAPGGSQSMAPGEGEAFGEVRGNADQLAAMMGGQNE